jgi:thiamine biosynthesis lipoprotein
MKRRNLIGFALGSAACSGWVRASVPEASTGLQWHSRTLTAMGTSMTLRAAHAQASVLAAAFTAAIADIRLLEDQMSLYREDSAIRTLNRTGRLSRVPEHLMRVLRIAQSVSMRSNGAFDVTVQPLWSAFSGAQSEGRLPREAELEAARRLVGWRNLHLGTQDAWLSKTGMAVTLNGIAQGYCADLVRHRLQSFGIVHALVDTGEWAPLGQTALGGDWSLGLADPRAAGQLLATVSMRGRCVAASADDQCRFSPDGRYHHIFDPRAGRSPSELAAVTVAAGSCVMADALTKVFFVAGYEKALPLARSWGVDVLVVDKQGRWKASEGFGTQAL